MADSARRLLGALAGAALLAACTADAPPRASGAIAAGDRVLFLTSATGMDRERAYLLKLLEGGGAGSPPLPPLKVEVVEVVDFGRGAYKAMRERQDRIGQYRAIYSHSITWARAAQLVSAEVPIVFEGVDDPRHHCMVDSLQHPGRNATGYMHLLADHETKMLELLHDGFPALRDVVMLVSHDNAGSPNCDPTDPYWTQAPTEPCTPGPREHDAYVERRVDGAALKAHAATLGLRLHFNIICKVEDLAALAHPVDGFAKAGWMLPWQDLFDGNKRAVVEALNASGRPAMYPHLGFTRVGGLMALAMLSDKGDDNQSVQALVRVLTGTPPAVLPVQTPRGLTLVVNTNAATTPALQPSLALLRRADKLLP